MVAYNHPLRVRARRTKSFLLLVRAATGFLFFAIPLRVALLAVFYGSQMTNEITFRTAIIMTFLALIFSACALLLKRWNWLIDSGREVIGE